MFLSSLNRHPFQFNSWVIFEPIFGRFFNLIELPPSRRRPRGRRHDAGRPGGDDVAQRDVAGSAADVARRTGVLSPRGRAPRRAGRGAARGEEDDPAGGGEAAAGPGAALHILLLREEPSEKEADRAGM